MIIMINVFSKGHWLGVDILEASDEYLVVHVIEILPFAKDLIVMLAQHGCLVLVDIVSKKFYEGFKTWICHQRIL